MPFCIVLYTSVFVFVSFFLVFVSFSFNRIEGNIFCLHVVLIDVISVFILVDMHTSSWILFMKRIMEMNGKDIFKSDFFNVSLFHSV